MIECYNMNRKRLCFVDDCGLMPYLLAWEKQKKLVQERINNPNLPDILILVEHPPVYTLGTGANLDFVKFNPHDSDLEIYRIERGGEVTYHCPGQIVGYPILNLNYYQKDLHWYLRKLEEVIIQLLRKYQLNAYRINGLTGVWINDSKVAAIGIKVKRWITMHGFALNVCPDLRGFNQIIPCGIQDKSVTSLKQFIPNLQLEEVKKNLITVFSEVFSVLIVNS